MSSTEVRDQLVSALEADLVGPFDPSQPQEVLPIAPSRWYLSGFLAPIGARETKDPTSDDELGIGTDEDDDETTGPEPEAKQRNLFPASMGMSVLLPAGASSVRAVVAFAEYAAEEREREGKRPGLVWRRAPRGPFVVAVALPKAGKGTRGTEIAVELDGAPGVRLKGKVADTAIRDAGGHARPVRALSLFVVNEREPAEQKRIADEQLLCQVSLAIEHEGGFVARPNRRDEDADDWDDRVADLQYRARCEWAVGHNVSVAAPVPTASEDAASVRRIETTWLPRHAVEREVTSEAEGVETSMEALAEMTDGESARRLLLPMVDAYAEWIAAQSKVVVDSTLREGTRDALMANARTACERIRAGIELLAHDATIRQAFTLANRAMASSARQRSPERYGDGKGPPRWRLFQLAFVLMNLPGLADAEHPDREVVELIFFPTGGGKTEAYLGVIATTLLLRRIRAGARPDGGLGVAVLLRYTLRLLTLDQLGRAATLVCALEELRRDAKGALGDTRFAVGLWVGRSATANTMQQVRDKIVEHKNSASRTSPSPCPLTHCPWCRTELGRDSLDLKPTRDKPEEVVVGCLSPACPFSARRDPAGIPVVFVDEQIYRELPSFLIATVDKLAMLPWRGETGMLFGRVVAREGRRFWGPLDGKPPKTALPLPEGLAPPELVVQDELHLIAGPLGTMVGLYETAVEHLASTTVTGSRRAPKIIASTATVRRAREQIRALFGRQEMALFPPPGTDESETFFARKDHDAPGRLYIGVAAPGRSMKAILLRAYVDLACAAQLRFDPTSGPKQPADPYMTLAGYFNSLRELGGMRRLVEDDVRQRSATIEDRRPEGAKASLHFAKRNVQAEPVELTSRETTARIAAAKARLALAHVEKDHVDVVLASNMISVGVDIDRLGIMVVAGQPKTTSEYIQASSRVGRQHPGLVVTCFNVRRPRDRSHYERFVAYHSSFYRFAEAQSLTPFSGPALDRGLAGALVAMTRLVDMRATPPEAVMATAAIRPFGDAAVKALGERAARQSGDVTRQELTKRARNLLDSWDRLVAQIAGAGKGAAGGRIHYSPFDRDKASVHMLHTALDDDRPDLGTDYAKFRAPTSMRDVEASVHLWIERGRALGGKR